MRSILQHLFVLCVSVFLVACETELGDDDLRIVNEIRLPKRLYYYVPVEFQIELTGGKGGYAARYIQNPESGMDEDDIDGAKGDNPVDLEVVRNDGAGSASFTLSGTPVPGPDGALPDISSVYWIEITDGSETKLIRVEYDLESVGLQLANFTGQQVAEGTADTSILDRVLNSGTNLCPQAYNSRPVPTETPYGRAFPMILLMGLEAPIATRIELEYEVGKNPGIFSNGASPYADFIPTQGRLVLEPGNVGCPITVYVLDDLSIEGDERIDVSLSLISGLGRTQTSAETFLLVSDNEPKIKAFSGAYTVNEGQSIEIPVEIDARASQEISVAFDFLSSKVGSSEGVSFVIQPSSGVVTFREGQNSALITVTGRSSTFGDSADSIYVFLASKERDQDDNQVNVTLNKFAQSFPVSTNANESFVSIVEFENYVAALANYNSGANIETRIYLYDETGSPLQVNGQDFFAVKKSGVDLKGVDLIFRERLGDDLRLVALLEASGPYAGTSWGGSDFVLVGLTIGDSGGITITEDWRGQHGSEADDSVAGLFLSQDSSEFSVVGSTSGRTLDGSAVVEASGGRDGLIYRFKGDGEAIYSRFLGSEGDERAVSAVLEAESTVVAYEGAGVVSLLTLDRDGASSFDAQSRLFDFGVGLKFGGLIRHDRNKHAFVVSSLLGLGGVLNSTFSEDILFYEFDINAVEETPTETKVGSFSSDSVVALAFDEAAELVGIAGHSDGDVEEGKVFGGNDVFFTLLDVEASTNVLKTTQFGTPGDDYAIDVEAVNDEKFLVLWKENHTSGDGTFRYRITPFAPDGTNLAPLY